MSRLLYILIAAVLIFGGSAMAQKSNEIQGQRKELEKIQKDVQKSRNRLDSLKREEAKIQKQLSERDEKIESQKKLIDRLTGQLSLLRKSIGETESSLDSRQQALDLARRRFLGNVRQLYISSPRYGNELVTSPLDELDASVRVTYLTALVNYESGNVVAASDILGKSLAQLEQLTGKQAQIAAMKRKRDVSFALEQARKDKQAKSLDKLRKAKAEEADRIIMLQQAAQEMEKIVARLEAESKKTQSVVPSQRPRDALASVPFVSLKGRLTVPYKGDITVPYGTAVDPTTHLKSFSPGITIKGKAGSRVLAVADGTVVYSGNLRGYGNFIIVSHDNLYYSTYAGLGTTSVKDGDMVQGGSAVGSADDSGIIKFELRKGRSPVDPLEWINIDAF
jgi:septal ring factor EnvC (AmiA/AmiB activator)